MKKGVALPPIVLAVLLIAALLVLPASRSIAKSCHATKSCSPGTSTTTVKPTTTTLSRITTTTTAVLGCAVLLGGCSVWHAGFENGDISEVTANGGGNLENSGSYSAAPSQDQAAAGSWSLKATVNTSGGTSGVRIFRWKEPREHQTATYGFKTYIPQAFTLTHDPASGQFWNFFQWKSRTSDNSRNDPVIAFYMQWDSAQSCYFLQWGWGWGGTTLAGPYSTSSVGGKWFEPITRKCVPIGRWFGVSGTLTQSKDFTGSFNFVVDGTEVYNETNVRTSYNNCNFNSWCADNEWSVNLYTDGISPNPYSAYFDEGDISVP